jgi:hypothetical protein
MLNDLGELKELVAAIKADHQAQKEKERRESWVKYVSLSMIFLAVLAAVATQRAGGLSSAVMKQLNEATFNQTSASDQWSFYQAKSIKENLYQLERERLSATAGIDPKTLATMDAKLLKYAGEKKDITKLAKDFEERRDEARAKAGRAADLGGKMGLVVSVFQIAIALGGICMVMKKRWLWFASLLAGSAAAAQMAHLMLLKF